MIPITMRRACRNCGEVNGDIRTKNGQDCVFCSVCGRYAGYNAPKTETGRAVRTTQTTHANIKPNQRVRIITRANGRCEMCGKRGEGVILHVGHILSVKAGHAHGLTDEEINCDENLISSCDECNLGLGEATLPLRLCVAILRERIGG